MSHYYSQQNGGGSISTLQKYQVPEVNIQMPTSAGVTRPRWSWCSTVWSSLSLVFCLPCLGWLCGFVGLMCALHSYSDHKAGDYRNAERKRKCAWGWSMTGIVFGILVVVAVVLVFYVFWESVRDYFHSTYGV